MIKTNCPNIAKNLFILLIISFIFASLILTPTYALTSETINFQGKIVRNDTGYEGLNVVPGTPACVVDGAGNDTCDFQVAYYTASTLGTLLLTETFTNVEIGEYEGIFELSLGSGSVTPTGQCRDGTCNTVGEVISEYGDIYLELKFAPDGTTLTETFSRMPVEASAYSIFSKYSEGAHDAFKLSTSISSQTQSSPTTGMVYYNTTAGEVQVYNGTAWENISGESLWTDAGTFTYLTSTGDDLVLGATTVEDSTFFFDMDGSSGSYFEIDDSANTNRLFTILANGNVGIGTASPVAKLEVAGASSTITNSSGNLTISTGGLNGDIIFSPNGTGSVLVETTFGIKETGTIPTYYTYFQGGDQGGDITYTLPINDGDASQVLTSNGSGVLSWSTVLTSASRWNEILAPNGNTSLDHTTFTTLFSFGATTSNAFTVTGNSLTSGKLFSLASSTVGLTGSVADITLSGSNAANTGYLLSLNNTGLLNTNTTFLINHYATGTGNLAFRVNDVSADTTPFVIDGAGNVGIKNSAPSYPLTVNTNPSSTDGVRITNADDTNYRLDIGISTSTGATLSSTSTLNLRSNAVSVFSSYGGAYTSSQFTFYPVNNMDGSAGNQNVMKVHSTWAPTVGTNTFSGVNIEPTINQTGTASGRYTGLLVNVLETSFLGTDGRLFDVQKNSSSVFVINNAGNMGVGTTSPTHRIEAILDTTYFKALDSSTNARVKLSRSSTANRGVFTFLTNNVADWYVGLSDIDDVGDGTEFFIGRTESGLSPSLWIETTGYIGIGDTTDRKSVV